MMTQSKRVLVTGGGTFLGDAIAAALLAEGVDRGGCLGGDAIPG